MQVKKFEAPTIQEALENIKRELGPEAIILHTKKHKKGFGLMSSPSVEVTAAVSERSIQKKKYVEKKLPEDKKSAFWNLTAKKQAEVYEKTERNALGSPAFQAAFQDPLLAQIGAQAGIEKSRSQPSPQMTKMRYAEIDSDEVVMADPRPEPRYQPQAQHQVREQDSEIRNQPSRLSQAVLGFNSMPIEEEVKHLKRMIEEMKASQEVAGEVSARASVGGSNAIEGGPVFQGAFEQLVLNGVDKRFAIPLVKKAAFELGDSQSVQDPDALLERLAIEVMETTHVMNPLENIKPKSRNLAPNGEAHLDESPIRVLCLVGPTGVGKTTTIAKIASLALLKKNLRVGIIHWEESEQASTYARLLNLPFRIVQDSESLMAALHDLKGLDLILMDTPGINPKDSGRVRNLETLLAQIPGVSTQLVVSSTTRDQELYDIASRFAGIRAQGLIFTKLDESTLYGAMYNLMSKTKLPLSYFTTGSRVPEDFEDATKERVVSLILDL